MSKATTPIIAALEINHQTIAAIVRNVSKVKGNFSYYTNFRELGLAENHLTRIQTHILTNFKRTVQRIEFQDTVASVTERLITPRA